jgi:superfamily II DNA or RNA helicase
MANILGLGRINKSDITIAEILRDLRLENPAYSKLVQLGKWLNPDIPQFLDFFYEDSDYYYVPRYYSELTSKNLVLGDKVLHNFKITLRDYQIKYFSDNKLLEIKQGSFIMNMKTGNGKTVCALYLINELKRRTLIVCETRYLVNQWVSRINDFEDSPAIVYNNNIIINNKTKLETILNNPISVITLKGYNSLNSLVKAALAEHIGTLVMDEGHRLGAKTFYPILEELPAKYRILLTATLRRKDSMIDIMRYSFGEVYALPNQLPKASLYFVRTGVAMTTLLPKEAFENVAQVKSEIEKHSFVYETKDYLAYQRKMPPNTRLLSKNDAKAFKKYSISTSNVDLNKFLAQEQTRRRKVLSLIRKCVAKGRTVLLASPFLDLMYALQKGLPELNTFVLDGDTNAKLKPEQLEELFSDKQVIFGSMKVVQEGMDVEKLDTLIVYMPISDIEQLVGRITRIMDEKLNPKVFYFSDNIPFSFAMIKKAKQFDDNFIIKGTFDFLQIIKTI